MKLAIVDDIATHRELLRERMPAILHPREFDRWLDRPEVERAPTDLLRPFETQPDG
jgi:putative SOS response-associated peptidase YedK